MHANNQPQTTSNSNVQDAAIQIIEEAWEQMGVVARIASQVAGLLAEQPIFWMFCVVVGFVVGMGACFSSILL